MNQPATNNITNLLNRCRQLFLARQLSLVSRKLYLADIKRFLLFLENNHPLTGSALGNPHYYQSYLQSMQKTLSPAAFARTLAALRQFGKVIETTYHLPNPTALLSSGNSDHRTGTFKNHNNYIKFFTNYLNNTHLSSLTIKSYKSDITQYLAWAGKHLTGTNLTQLLNDKNIEKYLINLSKSVTVATSTIDRKRASLTRFQAWYLAAYGHEQVTDNQQQASFTPSPATLSPVSSTPRSRSPFTLWPVVSFSLLIILVITLGYFGYRQFSQERVRLTQAVFPDNPTNPNRQLSFQGRLENADGTPVASVATDFIFRLYDGAGTGHPPTGGTLLYTATCTITTDADGVFSTQIGSTCGSAIDDTVFTQNSNVWLAVQVEGEDMDPRQQIATVAYALNSETLQGFPISSTVSAIKNTVVPMNQWGEIVIGEQSPKLMGVSGTLQISAPSLSIITATGTNGNINLAPDGTGQVNVTGNTTTTNFFNVSNAQLTTGSLITGTAGNNNTGFKLLDLLSGSSPTSKFSVTDAGLTTVGADLYVSSGISLYNNAVSDDAVEAAKFCTGDGETNCVTDFSSLSSGASIWTDGGAYIYPTSGETLGNSASAGSNKLTGLYLADSSPAVFGTDNDVTFSFSGSELGVTQGNNDINFDGNTLFIDGSANNIGLGTTTPTATLDVAGDASASGSLVFRGASPATIDVLNGANLDFQTSVGGDAGLSPRMTITNAGNVGIGLTNPTAKLQVTGATTITGTTTITGAAAITGNTTINGYTKILGDADVADKLSTGTLSAGYLLAGLDPETTTPIATLMVGGGAGAFLLPTGAVEFNDTFTEDVDTTLASHPPDTGTSWSVLINDGATLRAKATGTADPTASVADGGVLYTADATLSSADYEVSVDVDTTDSSDDTALLAARIQDSNNFYVYRWTSGTSSLYKRVGGTYTLLGTSIAFATTGNTVRLRVYGSDISVYRDSTLLIHATDGDISAAGKAGFGVGDIGIISTDDTDTTWDFDNFTVKMYDPSTAIAAATFDDKVGIGTRAPDTGLEVNSATGNNLRLTYNDSNGSAVNYTDFTLAADGGLTINTTGTKTIIADDLQISGDDLFMNTNTAGMLLVADGTNFNPTAVTGDISINGSGVTAIGNDKITESMLKAVNGPTDEQCLSYESTGGDFEWQTCGGTGDSSWTINASDGTLYPINSTLDLLVGGTASSSAKFAVLNMNNGTPTASLSAGLAGGAYLTAAGTLATTNSQTLTLGSSSTGNLNFFNSNNRLDNSGNLTLAGDLTVSGDDLFMNTNTAGMLLVADGTNFNPTAVTGDISINGSGVTAIGNDKITESMLKSVNGPTDESCLTYESTVGDFEWQTCGSGSNWTLNSTDGTLYPINSTLDLLVGGTATSSAKFAVLNMNDGTPTASISGSTAGAATFLDGNGYLSATNRNNLTLGNSATYNMTGNILLNPNGTGNVGIGDATPTSMFTVGNGDLFQVNSSGIVAAIDGVAHTIDDVSGNLTLTSNSTTVMIADDLGVNGATSADITSSTTTATIFDATVTSLSLGSAATTLNLGAGGSLARAINLGTGTGVDTINIGTGDTAADDINIGGLATSHTDVTGIINLAGGTTYYLDASGNVNFNGGTFAGTLDANGQADLGDGGDTITLNGSSITLTGLNTCTALETNGSGVLSCGSDAGSNWTLNSTDGTLYPINSTLDLLVGGTATSSAKFAVLNMNDGTPTASLSAGLAGGASLTATGVLATTNSQALTLGDVNTGNIILAPGGVTALTAAGANLTAGGDLFITSGLSTFGTAISDGGIEASKFCTGDGETNCVTDFSTLTSLWTDGGTYLYPASAETLGNSASAGSNKLAGLYLADSAPAVFGTDNDITFTFAGTELGITQGTNDINFDSNTLFIDGSADKVGIGNAAPDAKFQVTGAVTGKALAIFDETGGQDILVASAGGAPRFRVATDGYVHAVRYADSANSSYYVDPAATDTSIMIDGNIVSNDTFSITSNGTNGNITINAGSGTVIIGDGTGKLDAGTVDPPYTINGEKFATYMAGMTGVKEETTGIVNADEYVPNLGYRATVDFTAAPKGSDLWLFTKVADLKDNLDRLVVLLSPMGNAKVWYQVNQASGTLDIYSSTPATVSYRLTAPRFNYADWSNTRDSGSDGFIINDPEDWQTANSPLAIMPTFDIRANSATSVSASTPKYNLVDQAGNLIQDFISGSQAVLANVKAGLTQTQELQTSLISPLASGSAITITAPVEIKPSSSEEPALTVEGQVDATTISARVAQLDQIKTNKLYADEVVAGKISAGSIEGLDAKIASLSAGTSTTLSDSDLETITDRIKSRIASLTDDGPSARDLPTPPESTDSALPTTISSTPLATASATLASADIDFVTINNYLAVVGQATITNLDVTNNLYTDRIDSKTGTLNLADNTLIINSDGQVAINGDLVVSGKVLADSAELNSLSLGSGQDASRSALGALLAVYNEQGEAVATIDASGSANLAGVTTKLITIAAGRDSTPSGLLSSTATSNATAGESVLVSPNTELTIESPYITPNSLVYLTPTTNTDNKVLFVKAKNEHSFTVAIDTPSNSDISFNWWIIQLTSHQ